MLSNSEQESLAPEAIFISSDQLRGKTESVTQNLTLPHPGGFPASLTVIFKLFHPEVFSSPSLPSLTRGLSRTEQGPPVGLTLSDRAE